MSFREQLQAYIAQLEHRLRWSTLLRGVAILAASNVLQRRRCSSCAMLNSQRCAKTQSTSNGAPNADP